MSEDELLVEDRGAVRWLRLHRPAKLNALTSAMAGRLRAELDHAARATGVRTLVLTGAGRAFCAGADRREVLDGPDATIRADRSTPLWPVDEFVAFPKPLLVCLNGPAHAGGATMAMAADLRVAATSASLAFGLARVGLTPEWGSSYLLWRQVGYATALDLMLTGRTVTVEEALARGLVQRVVPDDEVENATQRLAEQIADVPAGTAEAIKSVLRQGLDLDFAAARTVELRALRDRGRALADRRQEGRHP